MNLDVWQWISGAGAALVVGVSKTGVPGIGILAVLLLANVFGGRPAVGIVLPLLIMGDVFAVAWYRRHAQWDKLLGLLVWVVAGLALGAAALWLTGEAETRKDILGQVIGALVLVMLGLHVLRGRLGDRLSPKSRIGMAATGAAAGFATTVSNAAGPIMIIYLTAHQLRKEQFMGTIAWYFFVINVTKLPLYFALTAMNPAKPIITGGSLLFNLCVLPAILAGVYIGKWLLHRIPQKLFETVVLALAAAAAVRLIAG